MPYVNMNLPRILTGIDSDTFNQLAYRPIVVSEYIKYHEFGGYYWYLENFKLSIGKLKWLSLGFS